jgi:hypothetical protein
MLKIGTMEKMDQSLDEWQRIVRLSDNSKTVKKYSRLLRTFAPLVGSLKPEGMQQINQTLDHGNALFKYRKSQRLSRNIRGCCGLLLLMQRLTMTKHATDVITHRASGQSVFNDCFPRLSDAVLYRNAIIVATWDYCGLWITHLTALYVATNLQILDTTIDTAKLHY